VPAGTSIICQGRNGSDWIVTVGQPVRDSSIAATVVVPMNTTYIGTTSGSPTNDVRVELINDAGENFRLSDAEVRDPISEFVSLEPGSVAIGSVAFDVPVGSHVDQMTVQVAGGPIIYMVIESI
jgi:hypothetical protein